MINHKEYLEWEIFADLEPDHEGKELYIFKPMRVKNKPEKYCIDKALKAIETRFKDLKKPPFKKNPN
jgi:hypothetical protein